MATASRFANMPVQLPEGGELEELIGQKMYGRAQALDAKSFISYQNSVHGATVYGKATRSAQ